MKAPASPGLVKIVICFHEADRQYLQLLETHLAPLSREKLILIWHVDKSLPGDDRHRLLLENLAQAHVIMLLVSADLNAQFDRTLARAVKASCSEDRRVIPVNLRPCVWDGLPFFGLSPLPADGAPLVVDGVPSESRFHAFAMQVRDLVVGMRALVRDEAPASTVAQSALFATLAWIERERFQLEQSVNNAETPPSSPPPTPATVPAESPDARAPSGSEAKIESPATVSRESQDKVTGPAPGPRDIAVASPSMSPPWPKPTDKNIPGAPPTTPSTVDRRPEALGEPPDQLAATIVFERGKPLERRIMLQGDVLRIGSHPSNDLVLDDDLVSRFHCRLSRGSRAWSIEDTGSLNGTRINRVKVRHAYLTIPECRIELGRSVVVVRAAGYADRPPIKDRISFGALSGAAPTMQRMYEMIHHVALTESTVLIEGESGTGKDLVAAEIMGRSPRAKKPFIVVDCGSSANAAVESEIFGYARGAFPGADLDHIGAFEAADGGTVFLDEIGELPLKMQPKLLRLLETGEIRRRGENQLRKVDVRVIATTSRHLERDVNQGRFREDLFFRLSVVTVRVPALRDRCEDIPILVRVFLDYLDAWHSYEIFTAELIEAMTRYDWPGNVRELKSFIEHHVVHDTPASLTPDLDGLDGGTPDIDKPFRIARGEVLERFDRKYLTALLDWAENNVSRAARKAKVNLMDTHRLLQRHGLRRGGGFTD